MQRQLQDGLVALQVALAVVLLVGAGLMIHSTVKLLQVDPGLDPKGLYRVLFRPPSSGALSKSSVGSAKAEQDRTYEQMLLLWHEAMVERLRATPGIEAAAKNSGGAGIYGAGIKSDYRVEGDEELVSLGRCVSGIRSGDYFRTLRVRLVAGRLLTEEDCAPGEQTVVINQEMARRFWPGQRPLGKRFSHAVKGYDWDGVVVGVIENVLDFMKEVPPQPT